MFFERLYDLRKENAMTQQEIANILHCKREVYRRYEKGIRDLPVSYAITLAKFYNVTVDYLLSVSDIRQY